MKLIFLIKWLLLVAVLWSCALAGSAQSIQKIEYFFDSDPGVGNGISMVLPNNPSSIDSSFSFDVSSLSNGLHVLYVRALGNPNKWSLNYSASFMKTAGNGSVVITSLEYFFDTDPGVGNGSPLIINGNLANVDSTFSFDVSGLTNGLHIIYIRARDAAQHYSTNYAASFLKTPGSDSLVSITRLEYFVDTDPGFGNGINMPIQPANIINDTFDVQVPDNGADSRSLNIRAQDSRGNWSLLYTNLVDMCQFYKAKPNFSWVRFADVFSFVDSTQNNPSHALLWKFDNLGIDSVSNPQFTFPQGRHSVKLVAGAGCRRDSVILPLFTGLEQYSPDTALAGGDIIMRFYGGGLDTNVTAQLINASVTISPYAKIAFGSKELYNVFDLHTATPGIYNVHLHYPSGYDTTIVNGFKISNVSNQGGGVAYNPEISIDVVGPSAARAGTTVKLDLVVSNTGGMLAESVPVWLTVGHNGVGINNGYNLKLDNHYIFPDSPSHNFYLDSVNNYQTLDTLEGRPWNGRLQNFVIPALNAGESFIHTISVDLPLQHDDYVDVYAWTGQRMLGSGMRGTWNNCLETAFDFVVGFVPVAGCVNSAYNYVNYDLPGFWNGGTWGSFLWSTAGAAISCIPGGTILTKLGHSEDVVKVVTSVIKGADIRHNIASAAYNGSLCDDANDPNNILVKRTKHRVAVDPNQIYGPAGYAGANYINGNSRMGYTITFENIAAATASAQRVYVADTLDKTKFDLPTFQLTSFGFGDTSFTVPHIRKEYTQTIDLRPATNLLLRFNAKLDTATGILRYSFLSIDPVTRDTLPLSDLRGFLPPNVNGSEGSGFVSYIVGAKKSLVTNDVINNNASIVFDNNPPIITNTWMNTIDKTSPGGGVTGGTKINDTTVRLSFGGSDVGAGIHRYRAYYSENNKPYVFGGVIYGDTIRFTGAKDSTYSFYAVPYDSVNNFTAKSAAPEFTISFSDILPVTLTSFTVRKRGADVLNEWKISTNKDFSHFEVERSTEGSHFEKIATVLFVNGSLSYSFNDLDAVNKFGSYKKLYYRLRLVDNNGTNQYSRVEEVSLDKKYTVSVYPNPARNEVFVKGLQNYRSVSISTLNGIKVYEARVSAASNVINIKALAAGIYIIKLSGDDDEQSIKLVKY